MGLVAKILFTARGGAKQLVIPEREEPFLAVLALTHFVD
jgi:hypothetical protein